MQRTWMGTKVFQVVAELGHVERQWVLETSTGFWQLSQVPQVGLGNIAQFFDALTRERHPREKRIEEAFAAEAAASD